MIQPPMTGAQADALAAFLVTLRPGQRRWTKSAVYDALTAAASRSNDTETLTRAAVRAALTPSIVSPEVIAMPGAHWETVNDKPVREGVTATRCDRCGTIHTPQSPCGSRDRTRHPEAVAAAREAVAAKRYRAPEPRKPATRQPEETTHG